MKNLLRKEFTLAIHPFYLVAPIVFGALAMIPQWVFMLVPLYFCFISAPNLLAQYKSNKDTQFTALLPVRRNDIVKTRILAFAVLELLHLAGALVFALIHHAVYDIPNFMLNLNAAYFGLVLMMFALFNLVLFPLYYRTADRYGLPVIVSVAAAVAFSMAIELFVVLNRGVSRFLEQRLDVQIALPILGVVCFVVAGVVAYRISAKRFACVEL